MGVNKVFGAAPISLAPCQIRPQTPEYVSLETSKIPPDNSSSYAANQENGARALPNHDANFFPSRSSCHVKKKQWLRFSLGIV
jgi:hypothetical protein